ncbi:MAG: hypothetical protein ACK56I_01520, partial [bacterium]
ALHPADGTLHAGRGRHERGVPIDRVVGLRDVEKLLVDVVGDAGPEVVETALRARHVGDRHTGRDRLPGLRVHPRIAPAVEARGQGLLPVRPVDAVGADPVVAGRRRGACRPADGRR